MSESLIIQLREAGAPRWMVCNHDGHVLVNAVSGELAQAVPLSVGRRIAVINPAEYSMSDAVAIMTGAMQPRAAA